MTKVRLLVSRAGLEFVQEAGEEIEVSAKEAKALIETNQAEPVRGGTRETTAKKSSRAKTSKAAPKKAAGKKPGIIARATKAITG